ncbi:MAG: PEPxxWA-CTERM sorting domain-containing protein [Alphaproteobacteria bacterium]|nr:PEPxxWA-CTERM sorting domain-containing protein [Alphaproteobacteria bacterium]MBU1516192.1 PEPxxWA-CTERM sorting domain-containing protein [Alphaproteobacteria bacterium]MBU2093502.1 PEPxxWA-CTERM sorting domain-containing protein [Alphaproteobacteria bacterium]MBU2152350.1 PEPxxWA-CTERM sorting domain-containing protein [Alphaproteobacteria bacterium]MBU2308164.1 PEPxxWA-CTERM sorting domain-containing protein [Alphaproteobacteria bacterium]
MNRLLACAVAAASVAFASAASAAEVYDQPLTAPAAEESQAFKAAEPPAVEGLENLYRLASSLPEPMTWAMMIIGFGSAGAILRRRKVLGEFD